LADKGPGGILLSVAGGREGSCSRRGGGVGMRVPPVRHSRVPPPPHAARAGSLPIPQPSLPARAGFLPPLPARAGLLPPCRREQDLSLAARVRAGGGLTIGADRCASSGRCDAGSGAALAARPRRRRRRRGRRGLHRDAAPPSPPPRRPRPRGGPPPRDGQG